MKVKDLMSADAIKYCTPETRLANAARLMKENNRGALPVVDDSHKVVGIITDRDICLTIGEKADKKIPELNVRDILKHAKVHTVSAEQPLTDALRTMRTNRIGRLPVTDKEGKLKGMLSINNILTHALTHKTEMGTVSSDEETLAKTINELFTRNNAVPKKGGKPMELEATD